MTYEENKTSRDFRELLAALPQHVQDAASDAYRLYLTNPHHSGLQFKRLTTKYPYYSVRIGNHYRAIGIQRADYMLWFWIGSHSTYDKLPNQLS